MTQFSFGWILSLNWLCQKWGQVQKELGDAVKAPGLEILMPEFFVPEIIAREDGTSDEIALGKKSGKPLLLTLLSLA
jgi:hypothetical protein